jgi:prepilin peptidase CpaA
MWKGEACLPSFTLRDAPRYATGLAAMVLSIRFMYQAESLPLLFASVFLFVACTTDTFLSQIPNPLNLTLLLAGFFYHGSTTGTTGLLTAFLGMLLGFSLLIIPHLLGGMGAGDVKALAALGALMGPWDILHTFIYVGLAGGVMAILHYAFTHNLKQKFLQGLNALKVFSYTNDLRDVKPSGDEQLRFPYAAAIAFGFFAYAHWGRLL